MEAAEQSQPTTRVVPVDEFYRNGLLWMVNDILLWPLGLALRTTKNADGTFGPGLDVVEYDYPDGHQEMIEGPFTDDEVAAQPFGVHPAVRATLFIIGRLMKMPPDDRVKATDQLADISMGGASPEQAMDRLSPEKMVELAHAFGVPTDVESMLEMLTLFV